MSQHVRLFAIGASVEDVERALDVLKEAGFDPVLERNPDLEACLTELRYVREENARLRDELRRLPVFDPLTGVYTQRYVEETLDREIRRARRASTPVAVIMLDIDGFQLFNDTFGGERGDALLRAMGELLRGSIRAEDAVCRSRGGEFTVILPGSALSTAMDRAERIRKDVESITLADVNQGITISAGVAMFPEDGGGTEGVLSAADTALHMAKGKGRNRIEVAENSRESLGNR